MRRLQQKRSIARFLCFLMILEMFVASPNVAEASTSKGISKNGREYCAIEYKAQVVTVTLYSPNKPENTKVVSSTVPSWVTVTKPNYNSPVFKVSVKENSSTTGSRVQNIDFTDGTNSWRLTLTQYAKPKPSPTSTPSPKPKGSTPTPKKTTTSPTKAPTNTPSPMPELTASETSLSFPADGTTKTVTISGYTGTLRADRGNNDTWFTVNVSGGTISVTATKNTSTARASYVDVTDTGSGRSVRIQVTQAAPIINPGPTKAPTSTPTPVPAETLPLKTKTLNFSAQGGQDTLSLDGSGYSLVFSFQDNPSAPSGWVGMVYDGNQIRVKVERNRDYNARSTKIKITDTKTNRYAYVTINQKAAPKPTPTPTPYLTATQTEYPFEEAGGTDTITLKGLHGGVLIDYTWNTEDQKEWAHALYDGQSVRLTVDPNRSIYSRTATIIITDSATKKSVSITVKQKEMNSSVNVPNTLKADKDVLDFECVGGESQIINISGITGQLRVDRVGNEIWFSATIDKNTVVVTVEQNTGAARKGYLDITDTGNGQKTRVTISQKKALVDKISYEVSCKAHDNIFVTVNTIGDIKFRYEWKTIGQRDWVQFSKSEIGYTQRQTSYKIAIDENKSYDSRTVVVKVLDGTGRYAYIEIIQEGKPYPPLTVSKGFVDFPIRGGTNEVVLSGVIGNITVSYKDGNVEDTESWVNVKESGKDTYTISTSINPNEDYRYAFVNFTDSETKKSVSVQVWQHSQLYHVNYVYEQDSPYGGIREESERCTQYYGESYKLPTIVPSRDGYTFAGWYTERGIGNGYKIESGDIYRYRRDSTLYAHWVKTEAYEISFDLNYEGCPKYAAVRKVHEGAPYGNLPTPPKRPGFEFAGWYTLPDANSTAPYWLFQVTSETLCTNGNIKVLYAHWKVTLLFDDLKVLGETRVAYAREGCVAVIPDSVLKIYESLGFKVTGWTTQKNAKWKDNGNEKEFRLPKNVDQSEISVWAVNASGQHFEEYLIKTYGTKAIAKTVYQAIAISQKGKEDIDTIKENVDIKEKEAEALILLWNNGEVDAFNSLDDEARRAIAEGYSEECDNSETNYRRNEFFCSMSEVQTELENADGYYNGQGQGMKSQLKVGDMTFAEAGCGIIACYNALNRFGRAPYLPSFIREFESGGYLMQAPGAVNVDDTAKKKKISQAGGLGPNPYKIGDVLKKHGLSTKQYTSRDAFLNVISSSVQGGTNRQFIVSYWTSDTEKYPSAHYVFLETNANGRAIKIYNRYNSSTGPSYASYGEFKDMMVSPRNGKNLFIVGYEVFG